MTQGPASPMLRMSRAMTLSSGVPLERASTRRTCEHPDCSTTLSRYNPDSTCARHGGWIAEEAPRRRRKRAEIEVAEAGIDLTGDVEVDAGA
jgi:hypothetical protein